MGIDQGEVRYECTPGLFAEPLNPEEEKKIKEITDDYYKKNWSKVILKIMRY